MLTETRPEITRPRNWADLKKLKKSIKVRSVKSLLGMSVSRDPFNCGAPADVRDGEWFAARWHEMGFTGAVGVHLRKLHYKLVSQGDQAIKLPLPIKYKNGKDPETGKPVEAYAEHYANLDEVWNYLVEAGAKARYLGLVPPEAFTDKRNPDPVINAQRFWIPSPTWSVTSEYRWEVPAINFDLAAEMHWPVPGVYVEGYDYDPSQQPYLVEVWCEKSTMDDVLEPLCRRHGVNYVTAMGFQSITAATNILRRAKHVGVPARILFVSDFDPAGDKMPAAVARQIEYWFDQFDPGVEVKVNPLALTYEQIIHYRTAADGTIDVKKLPSAPIKSSDNRQEKFLARYPGIDGAVELDALEALFPGELNRIAAEAILAYRDADLADRLEDAEENARRRADVEIRPIRLEAQELLAEVRTEAREILAGYEGRLKELSEALAQDLEPLQKRLDSLREQTVEALESCQITLPERPEPEVDPPDESEWMFDSNRAYLEQLPFYQRSGAADDLDPAQATDPRDD